MIKSDAPAISFTKRNGIFSLKSKTQKSKDYITKIEKDSLIPKNETGKRKTPNTKEIQSFESERLNC